MPNRSVAQILELGAELREAALRITGEANEAAFLTHCVIARALASPDRAEPEVMRRNLVERAHAATRA